MSFDRSEYKQIGHHVVALIDFLGEKEFLRKWNFWPDEKSMPAFVEAVRHSYGRVQRWREDFANYVEMFVKNYQRTPEDLAHAPDGGRAYLDFQALDIRFTRFSDTIVVHSPLLNHNGAMNITNLLGYVTVLGTMMLAGLADRRIPFRSAIEVGMGLTFDEGDFYGPALMGAYCLEQTQADFPRIVVSPSVISLLEDIRRSNDHSPQMRANQEAAELCMQGLSTDDQGIWYVDYLNNALMSLDISAKERTMMVENARSFILDEKQKFAQAGNDHIARKYLRLNDYFSKTD